MNKKKAVKKVVLNNGGSNERNYKMIGFKVTEMKEWMNWIGLSK